jgi:hypothetical protein
MLLGFSALQTEARQSAASPLAEIHPELQFQVPPARMRTWKEMEAEAQLAAGRIAPAAREIRFLPTVGEAAYREHKSQAARIKALQAPAGPAIESAVPLAPAAFAATINFDGVDSVTAGGFYPPDTHGAAGLNHFVEVTNFHLDIYLKAVPSTRVKSVSLNNFFGYTAQTLFDPRVVYDPVFHRWIISASAFRESDTVQWFFFAVSQTDDPTGAFFINQINVSAGPATLWDYPQVGLDRQAVIFTANFFNGTTYIDARMFTVAKSLLYSGQSFTLQMLTGLAGTLTPPLVLDENPNTYLLAAGFADNKVTLYILTNSASSPSLTPAIIPVPAYTAPPDAPQPGTTLTLDTLDSRFVNVSTQIGNSLFQVHTINIEGFARPRFYEFDPVNLQVIQSGTFAAGSASYDFNASIAANVHKDVFVTWSATAPGNGVNAEVRFSGRLHLDPPGVIPGPGSLLFGSATFYGVNSSTISQRWGDYSAVSLDPADPAGVTAWIVNERILTTTSWGSRIGRIGLPSFDYSMSGIYLLLLGD